MAEPERNLVLVREAGSQSQADFEDIAGRISALAPDIETFIVNNAIGNAVTRKKAAARPSLIVSFRKLRRFKPVRGRVYQGGFLTKTEQMARLAAADVPVPKSAVVTPDLALDPKDWGDPVILKPLAQGHGSFGAGVSLSRCRDVRFRAPETYPEGHPGRDGPMLVQQFIDCGVHPSVYRVLTLFGVPLYAFLIVLDQARPAIELETGHIETATVASNSGDRQRIMTDDADVLAMARAIYTAFPEIPLQGCDIIRDITTRDLYALEINAGGNTWQFSSDHARPMVEQMGGAHVLKDQFGAFDLAARALIDATRRDAQ